VALQSHAFHPHHHHLSHAASSPSPSTNNLVSAAHVAVLTMHFDSDLYVARSTINSTQSAISHQPVSEVSSLQQLYGLLRLICHTHLFDSHPPPTSDGHFIPDTDRTSSSPSSSSSASSSASLLPSFLLTTPARTTGDRRSSWMSREFPLMALLDESLFQDEARTASHPERTLHAFLVLSTLVKDSETGIGGSSWRHLIDPSLLSRCEIRVLDEGSQSWLPTGSLMDSAGSAIRGRSSVHWMRRTSEQSLARQRLTQPTKPTPINMDVARNLMRGMRKVDGMARMSRGASTSASQFLETGSGSGAGSGARSQVQFAGLIKGILGPMMKSVGKPMGNIIGDVTAQAMLDPIADKVLTAVTESLQSGMSPFIVSDIVVSIIPSVCETVTAALTESTAKAISDNVVAGCSETITQDVADRVTSTIVQPATFRSSQIISVKTSKLLFHSLTHVLSRSIPHIIVPALLNTVSVGVKEDYYCWFCNQNGVYCQYCQRSRADTMNRLYYALYYTAYHTAYYGPHYTSQDRLGYLLVQRRQHHPLDEVDDSAEQSWDITGRMPIEGLQQYPDAAAQPIQPDGQPVPSPEEARANAQQAQEQGEEQADAGAGAEPQEEVEYVE